jgi:hypothetical protein
MMWVVATEPAHSKFELPPIVSPIGTGSASLDLRPSVHGFRFVNHFEGSPLPPSAERLLGIRLDAFGLCGGMSFAAADMFLADRSRPDQAAPPPAGSALYGYLYRRQADSLGGLYVEGLRFARWMALPEGTIAGTAKRTEDELRSARALLDSGLPAVLGLNYIAAGEAEVWQNHQVLAFGYDATGDGAISIRVYDPNFPGRDDVTIRGKSITVGTLDDPTHPGAKLDVTGLECRQFVGPRDLRPVRGFFVMPYAPVIPPTDLSSDERRPVPPAQ